MSFCTLFRTGRGARPSLKEKVRAKLRAPLAVSLARKEQDHRAGVSYCWQQIACLFLPVFWRSAGASVLAYIIIIGYSLLCITMYTEVL